MAYILKRSKYFLCSQRILNYYKKVDFWIIFAIIAIFVYIFGLLAHPFELSYETAFSYPLKGNIKNCVAALANKQTVDCRIINSYDYKFLIDNKLKCDTQTPIKLVLIIKSAIDHVDRRAAIRESWGHENRFSDVTIKRLFILGVDEENQSSDLIQNEQNKYGDIIQANFLDTYYNNTIKTMVGFSWAAQHCPNGQFYVFSDDDMFVSIKNILKFIRNPTEYPEYQEKSNNSAVSNFINKGLNYELPENVLFLSGFVHQSAPHRHQCSKWYVSLKEYPYDFWPPYPSAGSYIVSREALKLMHYASFFTQHFRFDDIYLGLLAKKLGIEPFHCPKFLMFEAPYDAKNFKYVLAAHGFHSQEMTKIWLEQKMLGNA